jgi:threonine dehydratase
MCLLGIARLHYQIEGAAAVALAGLLKRQELVRGRRAAVIVCSANISLATLASIVCVGTSDL